MSLTNPEVIAGARGPREERDALARSQAAERTQVRTAIPEGEVWYQGLYSKLRIQLTAPIADRLPDGRVRQDKALVAQFDNYFLRLKLSHKKDKALYDLLEEHPSKDKLFWNFSKVIEKRDQDARDKAVAVLQDPGQRELILQALKAEGVDFQLPGTRTRSKADEDRSAPLKA
jgi:hypothetical protein